MLEANRRFVEHQTEMADQAAEKRITPDVRRTLIFHKIISALVQRNALAARRGLEVGTGYGGPILSYARLLPQVMWYGVEHPNRQYLREESYWQLFEQQACHLQTCDIANQALPFENESFGLITFSEVLEHLPPEKILFVLGELRRVLCRGGWLVASSPNQVSLACRIRTLLGKSMFDLPIPLEHAGGTFGHIRLYTVEEFVALAKIVGLQVCDAHYSTLHGQSIHAPGFWMTMRFLILRLSEQLARPVTKRLADTWFVVLRKTDQCSPVARS